MENTRSEICTGVFRSSTNLESFQNMLSVLSRNAQEQGPVEGGGSLLQQAAAAQAPAGRGSNVDLPKPQDAPKPVKRDMPKVGRNEPCPCGSGKKFKKCCGRAA